MPVITINGPIGSGLVEIGQRVSQQLGISYVDRLELAEAAKLVGSPVQALMEKEQRPNHFGDRLARLLRAMGSADQGYGFWADALPETYTELTKELAPQSREVNDKAFIEATTEL